MNDIPPREKTHCVRCKHAWELCFEEDILPLNHGACEIADYHIYLIRNILNRRIYVGRTSRYLELRMGKYSFDTTMWKYKWQQRPPHQWPAVYRRLINQAMIEHGIDAFDMILLEKGSRERGNREGYWIAKLGATHPHKGYNHRSWG